MSHENTSRRGSFPFRKTVVWNELKWCSIDLLNNALRTGLVVLYAWLSWREGGVILLGTAVMVHQYAQQAGTVVGAMASHWQELVRNQTDIACADDILDEPVRSVSSGCLSSPWTEIGLADVSFTYQSNGATRTALDGVALNLRSGSRIALIGESGSGKSTLLRVLAGLYEADRIRVTVDGGFRPDLRDLGSIGTLVPQDPEIFESSVAHNITMGIDYTDDDIDRACQLACLAPILQRLPSGLDTPIQERGANLSGGQKQRLALARGILASRGSSLIMLDEPTSSLDASTEIRVYDNILSEFPEACVISAIHRLHLLSRFDLVVLMAEGRIIDAGTVTDLLCRCPPFQAMWANYHGAGKAAGSDDLGAVLAA